MFSNCAFGFSSVRSAKFSSKNEDAIGSHLRFLIIVLSVHLYYKQFVAAGILERYELHAIVGHANITCSHTLIRTTHARTHADIR